MAKKFRQVFKIKSRVSNDPIHIDSILGEVKTQTKVEEAPKKKGSKKAKVVEENPQTEEITEVNG